MKKRILTTLILISISGQFAYADEDPTCNVEEKDCPNGVSSTDSSLLDTISVTANRMDTEVSKYAGQVTVLDEDRMQGTDNVISNLATVPGIQTGLDYGRSIGSQFKIRGFGYQSENRVIIEQDGVKRSPTLFSNHISTFRVDSNLLKRVEVIKGASSVLHGSGAIGGIISMKTKSAQDFINEGKQIGFTIGGRYESNNLHSARMAFAIDPESTPIDLLVYAKKSSIGDTTLSDGGVIVDDVKVEDVHNDEDINTGYIKVGLDINDEQRLSLSAYKYKEELTTTWQTLYHRDPGKYPVDGNLRQSDFVAEYTYQPTNNNWIDLEVKAYSSDASYHRILSGVSRGKPYLVDYTNQDERYGLSMQNISLFDVGETTHRMVAGVEYDKREENAVHSRDGVFSDWGSFPNYYNDFGAFIQDTMTLGIVDFTIGGRYDSFKRGVDLPGKQSYSGSHFSPKIATAIEVSDGVNLLAGYAETFRGPQPNETSSEGTLNPHYWYVPNVDLRPETAKEIEVGFSIDKDNIFSADDNLFVKATYFDGKIEDMIRLTEAPELGTPPRLEENDEHVYAQYRNINNAHRKGVEVEADYKSGAWRLGAGYEHLKLYNEDTGERLDAFADKLSLRGSYFYEPWGMSLGLQATHWFKPKRDTYTFTRWGDTYEYINKTFTIVDLKGQWTPHQTGYDFLDEGVNVRLGVNNLFDKNYINPSNTTSTSRIGKGRNIYLEFEKTF